MHFQEYWVRLHAGPEALAITQVGIEAARPAPGVEEALAGAGATPGCPVTIGDVTFDWEPSTPAGVAVMLSGRGTDRRLDQTARSKASDRLAARIDRRRHRTDEELLTGTAEDEE